MPHVTALTRRIDTPQSRAASGFDGRGADHLAR